MRLFEVKSSMVDDLTQVAASWNRTSMITYLDNIGATIISSRPRSIVFKTKEGLFKLYKDPAFDAWVKAVYGLDNPHTPRFSNPVDIGNGVKLIQMENLKPYRYGENILAGFKVYVKTGDIARSTIKDFPNLDHYVQIGEILKELMVQGYSIDDVPGNVMRRGNTIIVTDPVAVD